MQVRGCEPRPAPASGPEIVERVDGRAEHRDRIERQLVEAGGIRGHCAQQTAETSEAPRAAAESRARAERSTVVAVMRRDGTVLP